MTPAVKDLCDWASQVLEHVEGLDDPGHENYAVGHHVRGAIDAVHVETRESLVQDVIRLMRILETGTFTADGFALARGDVLEAACRLSEWKP
jgi:hypothetical protein